MTMIPLRRRGAATAVAIVSTALLLAGCSADASEATRTEDTDSGGSTHTIEAENGTVEVPADPQRVVTIGNTGLPFVDMGGEPVGVSTVSESDLAALSEEQQATIGSATDLGTNGEDVDLEKLASLEPDLILVQFSDGDWDQVGAQLETIAPTVYWGLDTEWKELADGLAEAGNVTERLSEQEAEFASKVADIQETYGDLIADTSFVNVDRWSSADPGTFYISDIGCVEVAQGDVGISFPEAADGEDPLAWTALPFEQISELSEYDAITYPVDADGQPTEAFAPVAESSIWQALPAVNSGRALGVFCPGNNSYGAVNQYLDSLASALAILSAEE